MRRHLLIVFTAIAILGFVDQLHAQVLSLRYSTDGVTWTQIDDNSQGDLNTNAGTINFSASTGAWNVFGAGGVGPLPGQPNLVLNSNVTVQIGGAPKLIVQVSQTGITSTPPAWNFEWLPTLLHPGLSPKLQSYADASNTLWHVDASCLDRPEQYNRPVFNHW